MTRRKLLIALATAGLYALLAATASAELHRLQVTLVTGQTIVVTVDVPPGVPPTSVTIPELPAPASSITDLGPVATPTPVGTPELPAVPSPAQPGTPTPSPATPTPSPGSTPDPPRSDAGNPVKGGSSPNRSGGQARTPADPVDADQTGANAESLIGKVERAAKPDPKNPTRNTDGSPTLQNPTISFAQPGAARIGVPNFFIDKFRIPPFLLPIYQAAGIQYGVRWEVLVAINEIESDYGRNLNVSSAGALGWMQFMPATWKQYGTDANKDGLRDPYSPVDAIFATARYLKAAGAEQDLRKAIFAYNHADWYVDSVLLRARVLGGLPSNFVGSLTGLTQGRFPVHAKARYADDISDT